MADVELRPMTLGEVLDRTFKLYKNNFLLFVGIATLPALALLAVQVFNSWIQAENVARTTGQPGTLPSAGLILGVMAGAFLFLIVYFLMLGYTQAATVFAVSDLYLGRTPTIGGSYKRVGAKAFRVLFILFLVFLVVMVGLVILIIPGLILMCRTALSVPASMLEGSGPIRSIERSRELTKGHAMQIFLIFLMGTVLAVAAAALFELPFTFLAETVSKTNHSALFGTLLLRHVGEFLSQVLIGPISTIAFSLMYYNLRIRKEAFDIQHLMASLGTTPTPSAPSAA
jgi:hypothetical protein